MNYEYTCMFHSLRRYMELGPLVSATTEDRKLLGTCCEVLNDKCLLSF